MNKLLTNFLTKYLIYFILLLALLIRLNGINFDLPYMYWFDESLLMNLTVDILATGDLNPNWFGWPGSFIVYVLSISFLIFFFFAFLFGHVNSLQHFTQLYLSDPTPFCLIGRTLMVIFAVITVYIIYLICKKMLNEQIGLLASFSLAIAPLHITNSRLIRPDTTATMLIIFSIYFLLTYFEKNKNTKFLILSSLFAGFSIATKYTSGVIIIPILVHCLIQDLKKKRPTLSYFINSIKIKTNLSKAIIFILTGFIIFAPFVLLDYSESISDIKNELRDKHLGHERLPGLQNHFWYLSTPLMGGIGGSFFWGFAGIGLLTLLIPKRSYKNYLFSIFPISYFLIIGCMKLRWERWAIPILPFEAIFFGVGFYYSYKYLTQNKLLQYFKSKRFLVKWTIFLIFVSMLIFASFLTMKNSVEYGISLSREDKRTTAKKWIENNLPPSSKIAYEFNGPQLHKHPKKWSENNLPPSSKITYEFGPQLHKHPKKNFTLLDMGWDRIVSKPISYYKNQSVDYIILTSYFKIYYYDNPQKYKKEILRYEELDQNAELIKVYDHYPDGTEIYKIHYKE